MSKKQISLITAILLVISSTVIGFGQKRDIHNHWAEELINYMVEKNVVNGYPDGTFKPENKMTKAEFYSVINGLIGYDEKTAISFNDVKESNWFYEHVQKGVSANYIPKTSNLNPNANITREEVARILSIVFEVEENHEEFKKFTDYNSINMELRGVVGGLAKNGYLAGYPDGTIRPQGEIKRSEVVAMLSNITGEIINSPGTNSIRDIKRNVLINTENSVLKDSIIEGNLYITEGVKDGDITLDNVEVKGNLVVKGGGENSVIIKNSKINRILVKKPRGIVRLVLESTNVNTMNASKEAKIELLNNTSVKDINIEDKIELFLEKGSIISILNIKGNESILEVLGNIEKINGEQEIAINGERIKLSEINEIKEGNVVDNKATETLTQGGSPSSGGSGGSLPPSEVIINSITIKGINNAGVIAKDTSVQLYADILPLNATNKALRWSVDNSSVLHISDNGYIYAAGKGIATVTATARDGSGVTGSLTITVTEEEDTPRVDIGQTITKGGVSVTIEKLEYHEDGFIPDGSGNIYNKGFSVYYRIENNSGTTHHIPSTRFKLDPASYNAEVNHLGYGIVDRDGNTSSFIYPGETREFTKIYQFNQDIDIYEIDVMFQYNSFGVWFLSSSEENISVTDISIKGINDGAVIEKDTTLQLYADIGEGIATVTATARDGSGVTGSLTITVTEEEDTPRVDIGQTITKGGVSVTIEKLEYHEDGFIPDGSGNIYNKGFSVYYRIENNSGTTHHIPSTRFKLDPASYNAEVNHLGYGIVDRDGNTSSFIYPGETREFTKIYQFNQDIDIYEIDVMFQHNLFGVWGL